MVDSVLSFYTTSYLTKLDLVLQATPFQREVYHIFTLQPCRMWSCPNRSMIASNVMTNWYMGKYNNLSRESMKHWNPLQMLIITYCSVKLYGNIWPLIRIRATVSLPANFCPLFVSFLKLLAVDQLLPHIISKHKVLGTNKYRKVFMICFIKSPLPKHFFFGPMSVAGLQSEIDNSGS